jgi:putative transposase
MLSRWRKYAREGLTVHSDRGSQYYFATYQALLDEHGLLCSMSGTGNCYDNACAESLFHTLKVESVHGERFLTAVLMRQTVFEYIEADYNRTRRRSAIGYLSPEAFAARHGS